MMYLVTWSTLGKRYAMLVTDPDVAFREERYMAGFDAVCGTDVSAFDVFDLHHVAVAAEEHDRIVAAKDAQIAALEARPRCFAVAFVTNEHGELLLIHNRNRGGWELPGGHIERDEHPWHAANREVEEESGITAQLDALPCAVLSGPIGVAIVYRGRAEGPLCPGDDADDASWCPRELAATAELSDIPSADLIRRWAQEPTSDAWDAEDRTWWHPFTPGIASPILCGFCGKTAGEHAAPVLDAMAAFLRGLGWQCDDHGLWAQDGNGCHLWGVHDAFRFETNAARSRIGDPIVRRPR